MKANMKLLGSTTSPYTRKARLVLLEKDIPHEFVIDPPREPGSLVPRVNPLARIPALILEDETCVFDSPVIAEYADSLNDEPILIPRGDARARMMVKRWEALADGIADAAVLVRVEGLRPPEKQDADAIKRNNDAISRALSFASNELGGNTWCEGEALTLADLALASALLYLDLRQPERDWRGTYANLATWCARMCERPSVQATLAD